MYTHIIIEVAALAIIHKLINLNVVFPIICLKLPIDLLNCLFLLFFHFNMELLTQFPASNINNYL